MRYHRTRVIITRMASLIATAGLAAVLVVVTTSGGQSTDATSNAANFVPINPTRVFDSRSGPRPPGGTQLTVNTQQAGAVAVAVNITITDTEAWGYLTAWPSGGRPDTSVINASGAGQTIANAVVIPVDAEGTFQIWGSTGMHVLVDLMGAFRPDPGGGTPPPPQQPAGPLSNFCQRVSGVFSTSLVGGEQYALCDQVALVPDAQREALSEEWKDICFRRLNGNRSVWSRQDTTMRFECFGRSPLS